LFPIHTAEHAAPRQPQALPALREATAERHDAIERLLGLKAPFGLAHYGRVLQGFGSFLAAWEPRVARELHGQPFEPWFQAGRRLPLLQDDLRVLGLSRGPAADAFVPALGGVPEALGSLYVLEGSALGGQFIAARAKKLLGLTPERGAAYFHGAGAGTAARWREFQQLLATHLDGDAQACERAARASAATFDGLTALFQDMLDEQRRVA
jgi:heme oxygenase